MPPPTKLNRGILFPPEFGGRRVVGYANVTLAYIDPENGVNEWTLLTKSAGATGPQLPL